MNDKKVQQSIIPGTRNGDSHCLWHIGCIQYIHTTLVVIGDNVICSQFSWPGSQHPPFYIHLAHKEDVPLTLSQCTLAGPVYTGMPLECHWLTQCTLEYHWATERILVGYTGTPLEKLSWNSPTLECHWRNLVESAPHWDATGETLTFAAYTGTPLEGQWQPTHARKHIVKHADISRVASMPVWNDKMAGHQ